MERIDSAVSGKQTFEVTLPVELLVTLEVMASSPSDAIQEAIDDWWNAYSGDTEQEMLLAARPMLAGWTVRTIHNGLGVGAEPDVTTTMSFDLDDDYRVTENSNRGAGAESPYFRIEPK